MVKYVNAKSDGYHFTIERKIQENSETSNLNVKKKECYILAHEKVFIYSNYLC